MSAVTAQPPPLSSHGLAAAAVLRLAARIRHGHLALTLPTGSTRHFAGTEPGPRAELQVNDARLFRRVLRAGAIGFAQGYIANEAESPNLMALIALAAANDDALRRTLAGRPWLRLVNRAVHLLRRNSRAGSRRNIAAHYDLGNAFYAAWLDPGLTYSAGLFAGPSTSLDEAQTAKFARIARLAGAAPGRHLLEIGCGWGGFAEWAAREIGCRVTAVTISEAQHEYASRRIQAAGLADRVSVERRDYRDIGGRFDSVVSIEMFEAVGERYWPLFFARLRELLAPGGNAALQVITIADDAFERYRRGTDFIQRYIFPGGMLPAPEALRREITTAGFDILADDGFALDYARTLAVWREQFEAAWPRLAPLGFDERFRRMWRYYLAYSEAGFRVGRIDLRQIALTRS